MNKSIPRAVIFGLMAAALPIAHSKAQSASCLVSPSTADCVEPIVAAGTSETVSPTFPYPSPSCEIVTNSCAFDFAVPVASQTEWTSFLQSEFINTAGSCASVTNCPSSSPPINGACASVYNVVPAIYNDTYEDMNRFGCASPAAATNEYQAPIQSGVHSPASWILQIPSSTWNCPGTGGGSTASCSCREIGTAEVRAVGPFATGTTFIWCEPQ